jgi:hypothetical protein
MASILRFDEWQDSNGNAVASAVNGVGAFNASETITATNASWPVPTLGSPIVKVTVIGGGGGGGGASTSGAAGGTTTFDAGGAGTVTAAGGAGGFNGGGVATATVATLGFASSNGGFLNPANSGNGNDGAGGKITVAYLNLTGVSTVNVTIGAGGAPGTAAGPTAGGRGEVIVEYVAA